MNFTNKVVLITGASSGIGAGTAEYFSKFNAKLALIGRNAGKLNQVAEKCLSNGTVKPLVIVADVTKDCEMIVQQTIDHFGHLNVLINNAGIFLFSSIETETMDDYDSIMNTNVRSVFQLTKIALPYLIRSKGNIVNVSSICGVRPFETCLSYSLSKATLDQFTKCMSLDLAAKGVRVNSVNPGIIITDIFTRAGVENEQLKEFYEYTETIHPLGRNGQIHDVATVIAFLAADELGGFMTGAIVPIDGGRSNVCSR